tara:strand:+ start:596 stop:1117 length:522 start_codon:yes stop_codon:yes gene_type:complete
MKLELTSNLKTEINKLLSELLKEGISSNSGVSNIKSEAFRVAKALSLIRNKSTNTTFELSEKGVFAIQDGGIEKYLENIRTEKDLDNAIRRLTKKRLEWEYFINILFLFAGGIITYFFTGLSEKQTEQEYINKLHQVKSEMYDSISKTQIRLNEQNTLILDIKNVTDSLKIEN